MEALWLGYAQKQWAIALLDRPLCQTKRFSLILR